MTSKRGLSRIIKFFVTELYRYCNNYFFGKKIQKEFKLVCDKTVEWNMILNKYHTLAAYFYKAPFIRFLLIDGLILPHKRYPPVKTHDIIGSQVAVLKFGVYNLKIYLDNDKLLFYDEENHQIFPPLLRPSITITYTEFRDLLCYLNFPVFCSTVNKNMLFFPNYDMHQSLLAIQGLPRNYSTYTGKSIDWKWFKKDEASAKDAINCFCKEFEESEDVGIKPVQYEWYEIIFPEKKKGETNSEKRIFRVCSMKEFMDNFSNLYFFIKDGKLYVYNFEILEHSYKLLEEQYGFKRFNYEWFEINLDDGSIKKFLFIRCSLPEYLKHFSKFNYLLKKGVLYAYDYDIVENDLDKLKEKYMFKEQKSKFRKKYLKYKKKYLELKTKYLELKNN